MRSEAFETLFGGAAGGGKSHGQLLDALRFAVVYPGSRQLMLRRTMPELERSLVPAAMRLYPQSVASYKVSEHRWDFINGSTLEFGYCDAESDVTKYQSAEYDVIRFDELTHMEVVEKDLKVMDLTAATLCKDNHIIIHVFAIAEEGNVVKAIAGEKIGTIIK